MWKIQREEFPKLLRKKRFVNRYHRILRLCIGVLNLFILCLTFRKQRQYYLLWTVPFIIYLLLMFFLSIRKSGGRSTSSTQSCQVGQSIMFLLQEKLSVLRGSGIRILCMSSGTILPFVCVLLFGPCRTAVFSFMANTIQCVFLNDSRRHYVLLLLLINTVLFATGIIWMFLLAQHPFFPKGLLSIQIPEGIDVVGEISLFSEFVFTVLVSIYENKANGEEIEAYARENILVRKLVRKFMSKFSHFVRTYMNGICIEDLKPILKKRGIYEQVNTCYEEIEHLTSSLVDHVKLQNNELRLKNSKVNVVRLIRACIEGQKRLRLQDREAIEFITKFDSNISSFNIETDEFRLKQVFNNLISNAIKYSQKNVQKVIDISASYEHVKCKLYFSVRDYGIGIPKEKLDLIFTPFAVIQKSSRKVQSMGLGLSICSDIVKLMSGNIFADSEGLGKGARIHGHISARVGAKLNEGEVFRGYNLGRRCSSMHAHFNVQTGDPVILVVDDNAVNRAVLKKILENDLAQTNVTFACNGLEAVKLCRWKEFSFIFSDLNMPVMSGEVAVPKIRRISKFWKVRPSIIALTANLNTRIDRLKCFGFDDLLTKPIRKTDISRMLHEHEPRATLHSRLRRYERDKMRLMNSPTGRAVHCSSNKNTRSDNAASACFEKSIIREMSQSQKSASSCAVLTFNSFDYFVSVSSPLAVLLCLYLVGLKSYPVLLFWAVVGLLNRFLLYMHRRQNWRYWFVLVDSFFAVTASLSLCGFHPCAKYSFFYVISFTLLRLEELRVIVVIVVTSAVIFFLWPLFNFFLFSSEENIAGGGEHHPYYTLLWLSLLAVAFYSWKTYNHMISRNENLLKKFSKLNQRKSTICAIMGKMSHDLRSPIQLLLQYLEELREDVFVVNGNGDNSNLWAEESFNLSLISTNQLFYAVKNIVSYYKLKNSKLRIESGIVDPVACVVQLLGESTNRHDQFEVDFQKPENPRAHCKVHDPEIFNDILRIMIYCACDQQISGKVFLKMEFEDEEEDDETTILIETKWSGRKDKTLISQWKLENPLSDCHNSVDENDEGIDDSISYSLLWSYCELFHGKAEFHTGQYFWKIRVRIPFLDCSPQKTEDVVVATPNPTKASSSSSSFHLKESPDSVSTSPTGRKKRLKILIAEDSVIFQRSYRRALERDFGLKEGEDFLIFDDGAGALKFIETDERTISILLTDLFMPIMDGDALMKQVVELGFYKKKVRRMFLVTGASFDFDAPKIGFDGTMHKPLKFEYFRKILKDER